MKIRTTRVDDLDRIEDIRQRSWLATYVNEEKGMTEDFIKTVLLPVSVPVERQVRLQNLQDALDEINKINLVICDDEGTVRGYLYGSIGLQRNMLHSIYLDPDFKTKGFGSALMDVFLQKCNPNLPVTLGVFTTNAVAIQFYKKYGFRHNRVLPKFADVIDSIEMIRAPLES